MNRVIFFNVAWMDDYNGDLVNDCPISNHKFIKTQRWGGEAWNFSPFNCNLYGYVEAGFRNIPGKGNVRYTIHLERIAQDIQRRQDSTNYVTVVWVAPHKSQLKTVVVGWYKNAVVYRESQPMPPGFYRQQVTGSIGRFFATAITSQCRLVPASNRTFEVPRGKDGFGRSNVWYADTPIGTKRKKDVLEYIQSMEQSGSVKTV